MSTRRDFIRTSAAAAAAWAGRGLLGEARPFGPAQTQTPWYRRTVRWMQTNIAEIDPTRYDIPYLNVPCVNGPFYREHIPAILREIAQSASRSSEGTAA